MQISSSQAARVVLQEPGHVPDMLTNLSKVRGDDSVKDCNMNSLLKAEFNLSGL